jgi:hypothetical protein
MALNALSHDEILKLRNTVVEAVKVKQEIQVLNEGLRDVVKHVAEELELNVSELNTAIKIAFKQQENPDTLQDEKDKLDTVEEILQVVLTR